VTLYQIRKSWHLHPRKGARCSRSIGAISFAFSWGDTDLLGILPKNRTEPENVVSRLLHFQRLTPLKMAGRPGPRAKRR
jgi:hypothetical protein